jgi:glycosyltransferase involved in cell wall biosynthesis
VGTKAIDDWNRVLRREQFIVKKVVIFQYRSLHYRVGLFEQLRHQCLNRGVDLHLVHGQPTRRELAKKDVGSIPWADVVTNIVQEVGERDWLWQPFPEHLRDADLVVVMQESRLLSNYPLLLSRLWIKRKVAYWGHGANFQSDAPAGLRERWKKMLLTKVDWWFAYTQMTVDILAKAGYPQQQITNLNNAIDNESFKTDLASVTDADLDALRSQLSLEPAAPLGLFCGSLYPDKRIDFMVQAADLIRAAIPNFAMVVIGDGPSADDVRLAAQTRPWLHWVGVKKGRDKAAYFKLASVVVNPGAVGLHVLDSFVSGVPMATTADARHGPEVAYLEHGVNGLHVLGGCPEYSRAVIELLSDAAYFERVRKASAVSAEIFTLKNMVENFVNGIERCLSTPKQ